MQLVFGKALTDERRRLEKAVLEGIPEEQRKQLDNLLTTEESLYQSISPIAWRHVNLLGRFEFQRPQNSLDIDELIKTLKQEIVW